MESHGLLVEGFHVGQTSLHLSLDVALVSAREPDASDALEWPQVTWNDEIHLVFFKYISSWGKPQKLVMCVFQSAKDKYLNFYKGAIHRVPPAVAQDVDASVI